MTWDTIFSGVQAIAAFIALLISGLAFWFASKRNDAQKIDEIEKEHHEQGKRLARIEERITHLPGDEDLQSLHDRISGLRNYVTSAMNEIRAEHTQTRETVASLAATAKSLERAVDLLIRSKDNG